MIEKEMLIRSQPIALMQIHASHFFFSKISYTLKEALSQESARDQGVKIEQCLISFCQLPQRRVVDLKAGAYKRVCSLCTGCGRI